MKKFIMVLLVMALASVSILTACAQPTATPKPTPPPATTAPKLTYSFDQTGWPKYINIGTKELGTSSYVMGAGMAAMILKYLNIQSSNLPSSGGTASILQVTKGEVQFGQATSQETYLSSRGLQTYKVPQPIKLVLARTQPIWIALGVDANPDSGINTFADVKGKAVGYTGRSTYTDTFEAVLEAYGLKKDDVKGLPLSTAQDRVTYMKQNTAQAVWLFLYAGAPYLQELQATKECRLVGMDQAQMDVVAKKLPFYVGTTLKPGEIPGLELVTKPIGCLYFVNTFITGASVPASLVYALTKIIYDNFNEFVDYHIEGSDFKLPEAIDPAWSYLAPYHEGAIKYFKEKGLWTADLEQKNQAVLAEIAKIGK